jgi:magnesium chelatase family protein
MLARVKSCGYLGIESFVVEVEADVSKGLPSFNTVGLGDSAVREGRDRVEAAIKNAGLSFPTRKITVNLAPADVKKEGASFDLPVAAALLAATEQVPQTLLDRVALIGQLSLDGGVRPVRGVMPMTAAAVDKGLEAIIVPEENATEAAVVQGIRVLPVSTLRDCAEYLETGAGVKAKKVDLQRLLQDRGNHAETFGDIKGQEHAKRALEVAAAGGHNVIMIGSPGSGKTLLARRLPSILPDMAYEEALETTKIHSVGGLLSPDNFLVVNRPFRSPHHTISDAGIIGGGKIPRPGEASLAHNGVLFLDELPEFRRNVLESLRQPMEDRLLTISRASFSITYPACFMLVASCNPCPCGYLGDPDKECRCTPRQIELYFGKLSGPLLDRIDIQIEVPSVKYDELAGRSKGYDSDATRKRVNRAREKQRERFAGYAPILSNSRMGPTEIEEFCQLDSQGQSLVRAAVERLGLTARGYHRVLKVSRTIADLEESEKILSQHVAEAVQYRTLDLRWNG